MEEEEEAEDEQEEQEILFKAVIGTYAVHAGPVRSAAVLRDSVLCLPTF